MTKPLQDAIPAGSAARQCFGCGADNADGLQIKSTWEDGRAICRFLPDAHHLAFPGVVNGGILATAIDCHGVWTAVAHAKQKTGADEFPAFVTRKLEVEYLRPTPTGEELVLTGRVIDESDRSVTALIEVTAGGTVTATGKVVSVRVG
jgi:acyl-coenzyme A thioesterase PaaI-like protein